MRMNRFGRLLVPLAALALVAAGCGRDEEKTTQTTAAGQPAALQPGPGFDGTTIKLGVISALSGRAAVIGKPITAGNDVFWDYYNAEKGGIGGRYKVEMVQEDSAFDAPTAIQKYTKIKNDVVMINQLMGTAINRALLPQLKSDNVLAAPASLDSEWVREKNLLPIGGPYQTQFANAASYYINEGGGKGKTVCFMGLDDAYGNAGLQGLEDAGRALRFEVAAKPRYKLGDTDFTAQLTQLKNANCEAVFLTSLPSETSSILGAASQLGVNPQWIGQSPAWVSLFAANPTFQRSFLLVSEGPQWGDESVPGMKLLLEHQKKYMPDQQPDIYFAFGYTEAWAVAQVLEKAVELGDLSREGIIKATEQVGTLRFEGLSGDYKYGPPRDRVPPSRSTIFKVNPAAPGGLEGVKVNFSTPTAERVKY
jgi:ABC-type branched-subunit amino acid transport system substrate-binding protein